MITSDRDVGIMFHVTLETKETFRKEAARRKIGMSQLLSNIIEKWLETASDEILDQKRSNKRDPIKFHKDAISLTMVPLKDDEKQQLLDRMEAVILPAIPGHSHIIDADGRLLCGCIYKDGQLDVALPLEKE